jgi:orotate phosphoribosyltransferase
VVLGTSVLSGLTYRTTNYNDVIHRQEPSDPVSKDRATYYDCVHSIKAQRPQRTDAARCERLVAGAAWPGLVVPSTDQETAMSDLRREVVSLVREQGYERGDEPFKLASGQMSYDYIDGKHATRRPENLQLVASAMVEAVRRMTPEFTTVGGLTIGADALAVAFAYAADCSWFIVRKEPKPHGRQQWIEGERLTSSDKVVLIDDVVTTGGSMLKAYNRVIEAGAQVVAVVTLVDRGDTAAKQFAELGVPYAALVTYADLDIEPVLEPRIA